jgi:hypothetical protein
MGQAYSSICVSLPSQAQIFFDNCVIAKMVSVRPEYLLFIERRKRRWNLGSIFIPYQHFRDCKSL